MAGWALFFSVASLMIALANLVWNIHSKFVVPKPRLECWCFRSETDKDGEYVIGISVLNHGPSEVKITTLRAIFPGNGKANFDGMFIDPKKAGFDLKYERMPRSLASGEECIFFIPWLDSTPDLYVRDSYGRHHLVRAWPARHGPPGSHLPLLNDLTDRSEPYFVSLDDLPDSVAPGWKIDARPGSGFHERREKAGVGKRRRKRMAGSRRKP